jgi:hypothetical protein
MASFEKNWLIYRFLSIYRFKNMDSFEKKYYILHMKERKNQGLGARKDPNPGKPPYGSFNSSRLRSAYEKAQLSRGMASQNYVLEAVRLTYKLTDKGNDKQVTDTVTVPTTTDMPALFSVPEAKTKPKNKNEAARLSPPAGTVNIINIENLTINVVNNLKESTKEITKTEG